MGEELVEVLEEELAEDLEEELAELLEKKLEGHKDQVCNHRIQDHLAVEKRLTENLEERSEATEM